jgi:small lipoprotein (TIGR04454 family)
MPSAFRPRFPSRLAGAMLLALAPLIAGCGHPATVEECDEIVERIARLELEQRTSNAEAIKEEIESTKESLKQTTMKDCVGKRITTHAMQCVRKAKTSKEIIERCFD